MFERLYELLWNTVCFVNLIVLAFNGWAFKKNQDVAREILVHLLGVQGRLEGKDAKDATTRD